MGVSLSFVRWIGQLTSSLAGPRGTIPVSATNWPYSREPPDKLTWLA